MALPSSVICTALPNGLSSDGSGTLKLSVFFSPHLELTGPTMIKHLSDYNNVFQHWAENVAALNCKVQVSPTGTTFSAVASTIVSKPVAHLWTDLFPIGGTTPVIPYAFGEGMTDLYLKTYPVGMVVGWLKNLYISVAKTNDEDFPKLEALGKALSPIELWQQGKRKGEAARQTNLPAKESRQFEALQLVNLVKDYATTIGPNISQANPMYAIIVEDLLWLLKDSMTDLTPATMQALQEIATDLSTKKYVPAGAAPNPTKDFLQAQLFFRPRTKRNLNHILDPETYKNPYNKPALPDAATLASTTDFHKMVGALAQYPNLMRAMGLVVDFTIPNTIPANGVIKIVPTLPAGITLHTPATAYNLTPKSFLARPGSSDIKDGMLNVQDPSYLVNQLEPNGSAIKSINHALAVRRMVSASLDGMPETSALPALRTGGLGLVKTGRGEQIVNKLKSQKNFTTTIDLPSTFLHAEDVLRGYRVDIYDASNDSWHSLFLRKGTYLFSSVPTIDGEVNPVDEGFLQTSGTKAADDSTKDLFVNEQLFSWHGWSLAAPRPGKTIGPNDADDGTGKPDIRDPQDPASGVNQAVTNLKVSFKAAKGSLPSLRFGRTYRIRMRAVDLAGNSLDVHEADAILHSGGGSQTKDSVYFRFEPVLPPVIVSESKLMTQDVLPHGTRVAPGGQIPGESLETLVIRSMEGKTLADYVAPFKKLFDPPVPPDPTITYPTAPNYQPTTNRSLLPPTVAGDVAEKHGMLDTASGHIDPAAYAAVLVNNSFPADDPNSNNALPDPLADGITLRFYDEAGSLLHEMHDLHWYDGSVKWPKLPKFSLVVQEDKIGTPWNWDGKTLTVAVPKSHVVSVRVSSNLAKQSVEKLMGLWNWIANSGLPASVLGEMFNRAVTGRNWMITPYHEMKLVHAVQIPLADPTPAIHTLDETKLKNMGDTHAMLFGVIVKHGRSTGKISLQATWTEFVDDGKVHDMPLLQPHTMHVFDEKMTDLLKEFKFDAGATAKLHEFGDTKHRNVTYVPIGSSRFREYFPQYASEDNFVLNGDKKLVSIPSSARPAAPKLMYIMPTFGWDAAKVDAKSATHNRYGGGLRVYLDRTWFSSGEGERLGVVIRPQVNSGMIYKPTEQTATQQTAGQTNALLPAETSATTTTIAPTESPTTNSGIGFIGKVTGAIDNTIIKIGNLLSTGDDPLKPYVTDWGMDPIWLSNATTQDQKFINFKNIALDKNGKPMVENGLSLDELQNTPNQVAVVAYDVNADLDRQVWYSDIVIDAGPSYTPFVRLALARYQPDSLRGQSGPNPDCCLSRVVLADFIQLVPGRGLTIMFDPAHPTILDITVTGLSYRASGASETSSRIDVSIEVKKGQGTDEELVWVPADAVIDQELDRVYGAGPKLWDGLWTGRVILPTPRGNDPTNPTYRIVVKEFETFHRDPEKMWVAGKPAEPFVGFRLVYADVVEI